MRDLKGTILLLVTTFAVLLLTVTTATKVTSHNTQEVDKQLEKQAKHERWLERRRQYPVTDFETPEPANSEKHFKRAKKSRHYEKSGFAIKDMSPRISEESLFSDWSSHVAALPATESAAIITGEVLTANAYLSNDKSGIYTEFTIRIDGILKGNNSSLTLGSVISVDRAGGFVRYPNGHKRLYRIEGQNMPRVGIRYTLFLAASDQNDNFHILTGYELAVGKVSPLDEPTQMKVYEGIDEAGFVKAVREAIIQPTR